MRALRRALDRAFDSQTHPVTFVVQVEETGNRAKAVARLASLPRADIQSGIILGDVIQNFRSALDHLAWDLVRIGRNPRPSAPQNIQFPIHDSRSGFDRAFNRRLPGVPNGHRDIILSYQPYRRGDGPKAIRWLRRLSNMDKHRVLIPTVACLESLTQTVTVNWITTGWDRFPPGRSALKVGAKVWEMDLVQRGTAPCQVNMYSELGVYPSLGYGIPVMGALELIRATVLAILSEFEEVL